MNDVLSGQRLVALIQYNIRDQVAAYMAERGIGTTMVGTPMELVAAVLDGGYPVAVLDIGLPNIEGPGLVREVLEADPETTVIVVSHPSDSTTAAFCLQHGAFDYLTKPLQLEELLAAVERGVRLRASGLQQAEISAWLKQELVKRTHELERERQKLQQVNVATLGALINVLEAKHPDFVGHSARVAELAATIAAELAMSDDEVEAVRAAGRLHDIGKIGVSDAVLQKKGALTPEEKQHIRKQVEIGFRILSPLTHLGSVTEFVHAHHENFDGSGYPRGLKGDAIPMGARIVAAAEVYDAITTSRPYQQTMTQTDAIARIRKLAGTKLDPAVVEALANAVERRSMLVFLDDSHDPRASTSSDAHH
ncbi:MAG TPA: HD domain-containing phosphohydrolase [Gemmatimonadales bacterium]